MDCTYMGSESLQAAVTAALHYSWKPVNYDWKIKTVTVKSDVH